MFALQQLHVFGFIYYCVRRRKDKIAEKKYKSIVDEVCEEAEPSAPVNVAETPLVGSIDSTEKGLVVRVGLAVIVGTPEGGFDTDGSADIDGNIEIEGAVDGIPTTSDDVLLVEGTLLTGVIVGGEGFGTGYPLRMCKKFPAPSATKHSNVVSGLMLVQLTFKSVKILSSSADGNPFS